MPNPELEIVFTPPCPGITWSGALLEAQFFTVLYAKDNVKSTEVTLTGDHQNRVTRVFLEYVHIALRVRDCQMAPLQPKKRSVPRRVRVAARVFDRKSIVATSACTHHWLVKDRAHVGLVPQRHVRVVHD